MSLCIIITTPSLHLALACRHFTDSTLRAYHARLQFFLLFFIDRSSFINDADPVWEVLLLFQKRVCFVKNTTSYHIVGYTVRNSAQAAHAS